VAENQRVQYLEILCDIIKKNTKFDNGHLKIVIHLMLRWYPQLDSEGNDTYGKLSNYRENFLFTERAMKAFDNQIVSENPWKSVH
jgi:hypothetical protein